MERPRNFEVITPYPFASAGADPDIPHVPVSVIMPSVTTVLPRLSFLRFALILLFLLPAVPRLDAQDTSAAAPSRHNLLAVDPLLIPFGTVNAEYAHQIFSSDFSIGAACWIEYRDVETTWYQFRVQYALTGRPFDGLSVGISGGVLHAYSDAADKRAHDSAPVVGALAHYNWLLGSSERWLLGVGLGAEVPLEKLAADSPLPKVNGNFRLVAGWTF